MLIKLKKGIYLIFTFFIGLFIVSSLFMRAKYNSVVYGDIPILQRQSFKTIGIFLLLAIIWILISIGIYKISLKLNKYPKKIIIPIILGFSLIIQVGIIFLFTKIPTADSRTVLSLALNMLYKNDYSSFQKGGYLYMFPFNFSTVLYLKTLLSILPNNYLTIKIFNIIFSIITTLMIYLIYKQVNFKSKENDYGVLIFSSLYIPALLMINYIYNDIIATSFLTINVYFFIRYIKEKKIIYFIIAAVSLSIGNYFRSIGVIFLIAEVIVVLLSINKIKLKRIVILFCIFFVTFSIPNLAQNIFLKENSIVKESVNNNSAPIYMWLNMGLNEGTLGYWDNMKSYNIYQRQADYNKKESTELYKKEIKRKLENMGVSGLLKMYYKKIIWTWTEGTYQIESYGIGNSSNSSNFKRGGSQDSYSYNTYVSDLFKGNSVYRSGLLWILYVMNFLIYCCIFIRVIKNIKSKNFEEVLFILIILGFIGFYILWEIKSRYIYPVYPLLIILSYSGFKDIYEFIKPKKRV